jgi:hypothetical protein
MNSVLKVKPKALGFSGTTGLSSPKVTPDAIRNDDKFPNF